MIYNKDVVKQIIPQEHVAKVIKNATKAEIGGSSNIRSGNDRKNKLGTDQLVGQIATYCGSVYLTGSPDGWSKARDIANANPYAGDGGVDIIGLDNVDIKGSLMRRSQNPLDYRLLVRERERHKGWIYVLGLVPKSRPYTTHLVGWAYDEDLPEETYSGSIPVLHGAYVIEAKNLRGMSDLLEIVKHAKT